MVKPLFIKLTERVLLRDRTVIPRNLSAGDGELIDLVTNNDGYSDLGKDVTPKEFINSLIIFNSNPEILEINHYGIDLYWP